MQADRNRIVRRGVCISACVIRQIGYSAFATPIALGKSFKDNMKRRALIKHLEKHGAQFKREGSKHTIYELGNDATQVPRHTEIEDKLARKICRDLNIPFVR
jgi:predicted RNA binding protein YcfA (HicA-like mRNA interferase family)